MKAFIVDEPWISLILSGQKTCEMRKTSFTHRGPVALIRKGSGQVVGTARIVDSLPPLASADAYAKAEPYHRIPPTRQGQAREDGWATPWVLADAKPLARPVPYRHGSGPVIWVRLEPHVIADIEAQVGYKVSPAQDPALPHQQVGHIKRPPLNRRESSIMPTKVKGRVDGDSAIVPLTEGNVNPKNGHFYLRSILEFFPEDVVGGSDANQRAKETLTIDYFPGRKSTVTDITGPNRIGSQKRSTHCFFRERAPIKDFFARSGAVAGAIIWLTYQDVRLIRFGRQADA